LNDNEIKVPQLRISFITKTDPKIGCNGGIETIIPVNYFLTKSHNYSKKDGVTKVQVIDEYGNTAWVTSEELKNGTIPEYTIKNGPNAGKKAKTAIAEGYRKAFSGEENLMKFIAALLSIPSAKVWDAEEQMFYLKTDPAELKKCECRFDLDTLKKFFEGNTKELEDTVNFQPNNRLKMLFGVRTAQNKNMYQCAYTDAPMKLASTSLSSLESKLKEDKRLGRHPSEQYEICNLKEYKVSATNYDNVQAKADDDPFASPVQTAEEPHLDQPAELPMDSDPFGGAF